MTTVNLITALILAMVSFRVTRFFLFDSMFEATRIRIYNALLKVDEDGYTPTWRYKIYELLSCTWCFGFWVSLATYWVYLWVAPWNWTRGDWLLALAITGIAGFLHALEPGE